MYQFENNIAQSHGPLQHAQNIVSLSIFQASLHSFSKLYCDFLTDKPKTKTPPTRPFITSTNRVIQMFAKKILQHFMHSTSNELVHVKKLMEESYNNLAVQLQLQQKLSINSIFEKAKKELESELRIERALCSSSTGQCSQNVQIDENPFSLYQNTISDCSEKKGFFFVPTTTISSKNNSSECSIMPNGNNEMFDAHKAKINELMPVKLPEKRKTDEILMMVPTKKMYENQFYSLQYPSIQSVYQDVINPDLKAIDQSKEGIIDFETNYNYLTPEVILKTDEVAIESKMINEMEVIYDLTEDLDDDVVIIRNEKVSFVFILLGTQLKIHN